MKKLPGLLLFISSPSFALEMEYYTYNGFTETLNAFTRLALIFNDNDFPWLIGTAVVLGLVIGALYAGGQQVLNITNTPQLRLSWAGAVLLGMVVLQGLILPKGTLHIYDKVKNDYQSVSELPALIVMLAGLTNKVERIMVELIDQNAAYPYQDQAGGINFELIYKTTSQSELIHDYYINKSLKRYSLDCMKMPLALSAYPVDMNEVLKNTNNLFVTASKFASELEYTSVFDKEHKLGQSTTCQAAWIDHLRPKLLEARTFDPALKSICGSGGFNVNSTAQLEKCKIHLAQINAQIYGNGTDANTIALLRNVSVANAISEAITQEYPDAGVRALANRSVMMEGIGIFQSANEWMPTIKASVTAIILGLFPLLICFVVTPLVTRTLTLMVGLFGWLMLWGISDALIHSIAMDQSLAAMAEVKQNNMGLSAILMTPESSLKAMAIFGKARGMGITIATFLAHFLFKMTGYAFSQMANQWSDQVDSKGEQAALAANTPEGVGNKISELSYANATQMTESHIGLPNMANARSFEQQQGMNTGLQSMQLGRERGLMPGELAAQSGAMQAGSHMGQIQATQEYATHKGFGSSADDMAAASLAHNQWGYGGSIMDNEAVGLLVEEMRLKDQASGNELSDGEYLQSMAEYKLASLSGDIRATNNTPEALRDYLSKNREMSLGQLEGVIRTADQFGVGIKEVGMAEGLYRGMSSIANLRNVEQLGPEAIVAGYETAAMKQGLEGEAWQNLAQNYSGGMKGLLEDVKQHDTSQEFARMLAFTQVAEMMQKDFPDMALSMHANGISFVATPSDIGRLESRGMITAEQADILREEGGGSVQMSFNPETGMAVTATTRTGQSLVADSSTREDQSHSLDETRTVALGVNYSGTGVTKLLLDEREEDKLAETLKTVDQSEDTRLQFISHAASVLSNIVNSHSNQTNIEAVSLSASLSTGFGLFGASAGASETWNNQESDVSSINFAMVNKAYEDAKTGALTSQEHGSKAFYDAFAHNLHNGFGQTLETILKENRESTEDAEMLTKANLDQSDTIKPLEQRKPLITSSLDAL